MKVSRLLLFIFTRISAHFIHTHTKMGILRDQTFSFIKKNNSHLIHIVKSMNEAKINVYIGRCGCIRLRFEPKQSKY